MHDDNPEGAADAARIEVEYKALAKLRRRGLLGDALRRGLVEAVKHGRRTRDAAERQAARAGLAPFANKPDASKFDPMPLGRWSVPMALAWIMWGTPDAVREQWDDYRLGDKDRKSAEERKGIWEWVRGDGAHCIGFECEQRPPASLNSLETVTVGKPRCARTEAVAALLNAGANDRLHDATGIDAATEREVTITASMWDRFKLRDAEKPTRVVASGTGVPTLYRIKIATADLLAVFGCTVADAPALASEPGDEGEVVERTKLRAEDAYKGWVEEHADKEPPSELEDTQHMQFMYPRMSRDRVRDLRREFAPEEWKKKGRRGKGRKLAG